MALDKKYAALAAKLGLETAPIPERKQVASGVLIGYKTGSYVSKKTGETRPMWTLYLVNTETGEQEPPINMTETSDERPVVGQIYTAGWINGEFKCVPGEHAALQTDDGDLVF